MSMYVQTRYTADHLLLLQHLMAFLFVLVLCHSFIFYFETYGDDIGIRVGIRTTTGWLG